VKYLLNIDPPKEYEMKPPVSDAAAAVNKQGSAFPPKLSLVVSRARA
jgi:hypothetical protein